jgi:putative DNA primase/helicase
MSKMTTEHVAALLRSDPIAAYNHILPQPLSDVDGQLHGSCPFHDDEEISLHVDSASKSWSCASCGQHGREPIDLYAKVLGFALPQNFWLAVSGLAKRFSGSEWAQLEQRSNETLVQRVAARKAESTEPAHQSGTPEFPEWGIEPWPEPVTTGALVFQLVITLGTYLLLPRGAAVTIALWILMSWTHDVVQISPILAIRSPEKRSGKTTLLTLLDFLVRRPLASANLTAATLFRAIEAWSPTLLIDEAETFLRHGNDEIGGIINAGHSRASAFVLRCVGDDHVVKRFSTRCAKALAFNGSLRGTLMDRSIIVQMRRKMRGERVRRLRADARDAFAGLRRQLARWSSDNIDALNDADPLIPEGLNDRAADNWRALLAIGERAGSAWSQRCREAALELSGESTRDEQSVTILLLQDLRDIFAKRGPRVSSEAIVDDLHVLEHRPWPEWSRAKPMTVRGLAKLLKPFGIEPKPLRVPGRPKPIRGYDVGDFADTFERYLAPISDEGTHNVA